MLLMILIRHGSVVSGIGCLCKLQRDKLSKTNVTGDRVKPFQDQSSIWIGGIKSNILREKQIAYLNKPCSTIVMRYLVNTDLNS